MSFDDFNTAREAQKAPGLSSLAPAMVIVPPNIGKAAAVRAFKAHADSTNDIFHIAAKVIARVILQASKAATSASTPGKLTCPHTRPELCPKEIGGCLADGNMAVCGQSSVQKVKC